MKKLLLSAALAMASMGVFAQASDQSAVHVELLLANVIEINPPVEIMGAAFLSGHDYNTGEDLRDIHGHTTSDFTVSSNKNFNVTINSASPNFSYLGPATSGNVMPCGTLKYNLAFNGTGGTDATPFFWNALTTAPAPLINNGTSGAFRPFGLKFRSEPGWSYAGGLYRINVLVTATQL
ncbi:hypothetical protein ACE38W_21275 [Chitinophaga sp. Hz27]|uniref:hypothetical protein n=1 Tax=Chitinophaga sp. Hz27 TaxID=3347169 RepID=UPI0035D91AD4